MGLGYGSEFQLMRFLGHHRDAFFKMIHLATNTSEPIEWMDYPFDGKRISGDGELTGIECFKNLENYNEILERWKGFWPQSGSSMNWDGIFRIGDTWYFVEAKANTAEAFQKCSASSKDSLDMISNAFIETKEWLGIANDIDWIRTNCYQLANRLAFMCFCNRKCEGIKAKLLYVSFLNGYWKKNVSSEKEWMAAVWSKQFETLGITDESVKDYLFHIYPDCEPKKDK